MGIENKADIDGRIPSKESLESNKRPLRYVKIDQLGTLAVSSIYLFLETTAWSAENKLAVIYTGAIAATSAISGLVIGRWKKEFIRKIAQDEKFLRERGVIFDSRHR